jgi:uncharacterized protein (TIGR02231 family)
MAHRIRIRTGIIVFAVCAAFAAPVAAQQSGRISRVTLYPGSAAIERAASVAAGSGVLEMTGLPANFDLRTLRVEAGPGIRVGEVSVQDVGRAEALSGREAELEAKIQALNDDKAALDVEVKTAELVRDYLASLRARPGAEGDKAHPIAVDPKAIPAVIEALRRGGGDAYGQIQRIEIKKRAIDKQLAALQRDLARLRTGARDARTLAISYTASRAGEVRAAYQVTNAGWKPVYRAALDSSTSRVELERQATIMQRTGEDWRGVALRLSTGQPRSAQIVDPSTWQLVIRPPLKVDSFSSSSDVRSPAVAAAMPEHRVLNDKAAARADEPAQIVAQFQTQFTTEFEVPGQVDLPADGRQVNVSLSRESIAVKQRARVVPRQGGFAMVTAEAELPEGVWIPGDAQLYRDGSYIGSTFWNAQAKEKLVLPFGRDDRIQVTTNRTKNRSGSGGLISQRNERQIADLYIVTSRHKVPVELLVLEASPVPVSDQISVEATFEPKPKLTDWEEKRGVVAWEQPLAPGETLKFVADYTIRYPKEAVVIGLP